MEAPLAWSRVPDSESAVRAPHERKPRGTIGWDILLGLDLAVIGFVVLGGILAYLAFLVTGEPILEADAETGPRILWTTNVWNLLTYGLIPFVWVLGTRVTLQGTLDYLRLVRPWPAIAHGLGYAALLSGSVILLFLLLNGAGIAVEDTGGGARFTGITWGLVVVTALIAGFAEEIFFRGILMKWIGVWGQAGVFGLLHLANGWAAFLVTALIGLLFGFLVQRGRSLWLVITAHAAYNLVLLSGAVMDPGNAEGILGFLSWIE